MPWSAKQVRASKTLTVGSGETQPKRTGNRNPHQQDPCKMRLPSFLFSGLSKVFRERRFLSMLIPFDRRWSPKVFSSVCGDASWDLCLYGADRSSMAAHCPLAKQVLKWVHRHFYSSQVVNPTITSEDWSSVQSSEPISNDHPAAKEEAPSIHGKANIFKTLISSWWFQPWKNIVSVKMDHFCTDRADYLKKRLKPPPRSPRFDLLWYPYHPSDRTWRSSAVVCPGKA